MHGLKYVGLEDRREDMRHICAGCVTRELYSRGVSMLRKMGERTATVVAG